MDVYDEDHLLISARRTSAVYKIDRKTGEVVWRLGGEKSDFEMGEGAGFAYQHDARRQPDGTITLFDNGGANTEDQSRGVVIEIDEDAMTATLVREYTPPGQALAATQGNVQVLPNGNVFVGWGSAPCLSEFDHDGDLLFDAEFPPRASLTGPSASRGGAARRTTPPSRPSPGQNDEVTIYASWNGATEVATWQVLAGPGRRRAEPARLSPPGRLRDRHHGQTTEPYVGVRAKDPSGQTLGTSRAIKPEKNTLASLRRLQVHVKRNHLTPRMSPLKGACDSRLQ